MLFGCLTFEFGFVYVHKLGLGYRVYLEVGHGAFHSFHEMVESAAEVVGGNKDM